MKLFSVLIKSLREQVRNFWIFFLTVSMAPFFVLVYYLIYESTKPNYDLLFLNQDQGITHSSVELNHGNLLLESARLAAESILDVPLRIHLGDDRASAERQLKIKKADALIVIPENFSDGIVGLARSQDASSPEVEFIGDLTNINYIIGAVWANEILNEYVYLVTGNKRPLTIRETSLGLSGDLDEFDMYVPGLLILSIIMLMFSAAIAIITEVEHQTIIRLKLSKVSSLQLLTGISINQIMVGIVAVLLTLLVAVSLGFDYTGSLAYLFVIAVLTSISIIAFSLILAAFTKTANEILIVGNFPLFLFMFFTGAAFPMRAKELFSIAGYPITWQGLMSPTHAIEALKKVLIMDMGIGDIVPELTALVTLTIIYFLLGIWAFQRRHMKVQ